MPKESKCYLTSGSLLAGLIILAVPFVATFPSVLGDATIYLPFLANFFDLPFSYYPGKISHGATSPLHVLVFSPIYHLFAPHSFDAIKAVNGLLIFLGCIQLWQTVNNNKRHILLFPVIALVTASMETLFVTSACGFESGISFFIVATTLRYCKQQAVLTAIGLAGLLPLARPELILITLTIFGYFFATTKNKSTILVLCFSSLIPLLIYHLYMGIAGPGFIPSSVFARALRSTENQLDWFEKCLITLRFIADSPFSFCLLLLLFTGFIITNKDRPWLIIFTLPLVLLYTIFPPQHYITRYLIPLLPAVILAVSMAGISLINHLLSTASQIILTVSLIALSGLILMKYPQQKATYNRYDLDTWLVKDLATKLNPLLQPEDRVLIYEVQSQFYLKAEVISMDGILQHTIYSALTQKETLEDFIQREKITYIVTMNAFNYRPLFKSTFLPTLFAFDYTANLNDTFHTGNLEFTKVLTNPAFSDASRYKTVNWLQPLNTGTTLRLYNRQNKKWVGHQILWNSVYAIKPVTELPEN